VNLKNQEDIADKRKTMKNLTKKNMNRLITTMITAFFIIFMMGCDPTEPVSESENQKRINPNTENSEVLNVTFDLPEGWKWLDKENLEAIWEETARGGNAPFVKLEFGGIEKGIGEKANNRVSDTYYDHKSACESAGKECETPPELKQFKITEIDVSTAMYTSYVWGEPSWNSHIAFEKNGYIIELMLYDKATLYKSELETIIGTMSW
jgi:hypothetical protein